MSYTLMIQHRQAGQQKCKDNRYAEAESLFRMALQEAESIPSPSAYEAQQLKTLGVFYFAMNRFADAKPLLERSLEIEKTLLGSMDLEIAKSLNHYGLLHHLQGDYANAEQIYKQALTILEKAPFQRKPSIDAKLHHLTLHLLAMVYCSEGRQDEAFQLRKQASEQIGTHTGPGGKDLAMGLHDVAVRYCDNDPNPEVRKTCGWLLHVFFDQLQNEYLGTTIDREGREFREMQPVKGMFAETHELLASYDEAWRPSAIYRNETLPEGFQQSKGRLPNRRKEMDLNLVDTREEEWRP